MMHIAKDIKAENDTGVSRIKYLDMARGICILLVILGHELTWDDAVRYAIYCFHIPMFFILSGMVSALSRNDDFKSNFAKLNKSLLLPYVTISVLYILFSVIKNLGGGY